MQPTRLVSGKQQVFSPFATKWSLGLQLSKHEFEEKSFNIMQNLTTSWQTELQWCAIEMQRLQLKHHINVVNLSQDYIS